MFNNAICLIGFELYSHWVPLVTAPGQWSFFLHSVGNSLVVFVLTFSLGSVNWGVGKARMQK